MGKEFLHQLTSLDLHLLNMLSSNTQHTHSHTHKHIYNLEDVHLNLPFHKIAVKRMSCLHTHAYALPIHTVVYIIHIHIHIHTHTQTLFISHTGCFQAGSGTYGHVSASGLSQAPAHTLAYLSLSHTHTH